MNLPEKPSLYNSPIEIGIRTLILLNELHPAALDITQLTWFNHVVVHTQDFGGPASLHPNLDDRAGELAILRTLVQDGLLLIQRFNLISQQNTHDGILYAASDGSLAFISLMASDYSGQLIEKAKWVANVFFPMGKTEIEKIIQKKINMWRFDS